MQSAAMVAGVDWDKVRAGVDRGARTARRELWAGAIWAVVVASVWLVKIPPLGEVLKWPGIVAILLMSLIPALALTVLAFRHTRGRVLSAGEARASDGAALGWMREELELRMRARLSGLFLEVALCGVMALTGTFYPLPREVALGYIALVALVVADAGWAVFRTVPRLQRERAELRD